MRTSRYLLATLKECPADAEVISHKLMLRAGIVRKLASGLYTWLPTGLRVLQKIKTIVRQEMNCSGAVELLMPVVQPADLWQKTKRLEQYGLELLKIQDRHQRGFVLGPTHEEIITELARKELHSYKQLPVNFYQIQTKFRDEIRPRFGVMRSREFLMKDAYSFHLSQQCLQNTYQLMHQTYMKIFQRIGLTVRAVLADTGSIGGSCSHEFHVLADSGEDVIAVSDKSNYAANIEQAETIMPSSKPHCATERLATVPTPNCHTIVEVSQFLAITARRIVKTLFVQGVHNDTCNLHIVALVIRGDHSLNEIKAIKHPLVAEPLAFVNEQQIQQVAGCLAGSLGPVNLSIPIIVDYSAAQLADFVCGANIDGQHLTGVNWDRDVPKYLTADLRNVEPGDPSPCHKGNLQLKRGIEVGHIFQLGNKYSTAINAKVLTHDGKQKLLTMGCYGIGISRIVAAAIEQNNDAQGIIWPATIAPFAVAIIPIGMHKSPKVQRAAESLYQQLNKAGIEVLLDDRKERPGVMFADVELLGIPHVAIISERSLNSNEVEYKCRRSGIKQTIAMDQLQAFVQQKMIINIDRAQTK